MAAVVGLPAMPRRRTRIRATESSIALNEPIAADLTSRALRGRPELQGLAERARQSDALARRHGWRQSSRNCHLTLRISTSGLRISPIPNIFAGTFQLSWTLFDGGQTRKRAEAQRLQAHSYMRQRADASADIVLEVRTRMLDVDESHQRVIVSGAAVASAEENIKVVTRAVSPRIEHLHRGSRRRKSPSSKPERLLRREFMIMPSRGSGSDRAGSGRPPGRALSRKGRGSLRIRDELIT